MSQLRRFNPMDYPVVFEEPERRHIYTGWLGHTPWAMALIGLMQPRTLVELGTHAGVSYCAFCQAVKSLESETRCYAVDTWQGDEQAGFYHASIYDDLRQFHDARYSSFSKLVRSTFDDALNEFRDGSVDLLHIDGLHTYDAVRHDFETWKPKLSERAIVLFHDIVVEKEGFGVNKYWRELAGLWPSFEFWHSNGLGVLAVGTDQTDAVRGILEATPEEQARIRQFFEGLGTCWMRQDQYIQKYESATLDLEEIRRSKAWKIVERFRSAKESSAKR